MSADAVPVALPPETWRAILRLLQGIADDDPGPLHRTESLAAVRLIRDQLHGPRLVLAPVLGGDVVRMFPDEVPAGDAS